MSQEYIKLEFLFLKLKLKLKNNDIEVSKLLTSLVF